MTGGAGEAPAGRGRAGGWWAGMINPVRRFVSCAGLAPAGVGLLLIGAVGFLSVGHLKNQARQIVQDTLPGLSIAGEANSSRSQAFSRTLLLLMTDSAQRRAQIQKETELCIQATTGQLNAYSKQIYTREDQALFDKLLKRRAEYLAIRGRTIALAESNRLQEAVALAKGELIPAYDRYREGGDKLFEL